MRAERPRQGSSARLRTGVACSAAAELRNVSGCASCRSSANEFRAVSVFVARARMQPWSVMVLSVTTSAQRKLSRGVEQFKTLCEETKAFEGEKAYEFRVQPERRAAHEVAYRSFAIERIAPPLPLAASRRRSDPKSPFGPRLRRLRYRSAEVQPAVPDFHRPLLLLDDPFESREARSEAVADHTLMAC
jgi:hypothetical protein